MDIDRTVHLLPLGIAALEPTLRPEYLHICTEDVLPPHHRKRVVADSCALGDEHAVEGVTAWRDDLVMAVGCRRSHPDAFGDDGLGLCELFSSAVGPQVCSALTYLQIRQPLCLLHSYR